MENSHVFLIIKSLQISSNFLPVSANQNFLLIFQFHHSKLFRFKNVWDLREAHRTDLCQIYVEFTKNKFSFGGENVCLHFHYLILCRACRTMKFTLLAANLHESLSRFSFSSPPLFLSSLSPLSLQFVSLKNLAVLFAQRTFSIVQLESGNHHCKSEFVFVSQSESDKKKGEKKTGERVVKVLVIKIKICESCKTKKAKKEKAQSQ
jgi:hypothetical protein